MTDVLVDYRQKCAHMVFRDGVHVGDAPYGMISKPCRVYTMDEALAGVSHPGADPEPTKEQTT